jgi:hypothetical protein
LLQRRASSASLLAKPVLDFQPGDALKVLHVLSDKHIVTDQSDTGDQDVCIGDEVALTPQISVYLGGVLQAAWLSRITLFNLQNSSNTF